MLGSSERTPCGYRYRGSGSVRVGCCGVLERFYVLGAKCTLLAFCPKYLVPLWSKCRHNAFCPKYLRTTCVKMLAKCILPQVEVPLLCLEVAAMMKRGERKHHTHRDKMHLINGVSQRTKCIACVHQAKTRRTRTRPTTCLGGVAAYNPDIPPPCLPHGGHSFVPHVSTVKAA
jgi:hypothetical protein